MASTPSGWYADPQDRSFLRYWDGENWTDERKPATAPAGATLAPPSAPASSSSRAGGRGLSGARRLADTARQSSLAQSVAATASSATRNVVDTAKDSARRQAVVNAAAPAFDAALDGAGVRNKKGKIKIWRVARAAARPRKTITRVGKGVMSTTAAQVVGQATHSNHQRVAPLVEDILAEWTFDDSGLAVDRWREGTSRFHAADLSEENEMFAGALMMCEVLKHCLSGDPILDDDDHVIETTGNTLTAVLHAADDESWGDEHEKIVRLALAVARRFGVQPESLGGNGELEQLFEHAQDRMRMAMSIAPSRWSCDLSVWFTDANPEPESTPISLRR